MHEINYVMTDAPDWLPDGWAADGDRLVRCVGAYTLVVQPTASGQAMIAAVDVAGRTVFADALMIAPPVSFRTACLEMMRAAAAHALQHCMQQGCELDRAVTRLGSAEREVSK